MFINFCKETLSLQMNIIFASFGLNLNLKIYIFVPNHKTD